MSDASEADVLDSMDDDTLDRAEQLPVSLNDAEATNVFDSTEQTVALHSDQSAMPAKSSS